MRKYLKKIESQEEKRQRRFQEFAEKCVAKNDSSSYHEEVTKN